jgi:hypothetical protein
LHCGAAAAAHAQVARWASVHQAKALQQLLAPAVRLAGQAGRQACLLWGAVEAGGGCMHGRQAGIIAPGRCSSRWHAMAGKAGGEAPVHLGAAAAGQAGRHQLTGALYQLPACVPLAGRASMPHWGALVAAAVRGWQGGHQCTGALQQLAA